MVLILVLSVNGETGKMISLLPTPNDDVWILPVWGKN